MPTKKWVVAVCCLLTATILAWWFWPSPSLNAQARRVMKDCLAGKSARLSQITVEGLISESGATPADVQKILDEIVLPEFAECRLLRENGALQGNPAVSGTWGYTLAHKNGQEVELIAQVFGTEEQGRVALLQLLKHAWRLRYVKTHGKIPEKAAIDWYEGLAKDRHLLESTRVLGSINPSTLKLTTWAQMEERFKMFASAQPPRAQD